MERRQGKCNRMAKVIDVIPGDQEISEIFAKKFGTLYNSVGYDPDCIKMFENSVHNMIEENINDDVIEGMTNINDLNNAIKQIKSNTSDGYLGLYSDHIINGTNKIRSLGSHFNGNNSEWFNVTTGVKQGGVLSPTLFGVCVDGMLLQLKEFGIGYHIVDVYCDGLGYANDFDTFGAYSKRLEEHGTSM